MKSFLVILSIQKKKNENHGIFGILEDLGYFIEIYFIKKLDDKSMFLIIFSFCFYKLFEILIKNYIYIYIYIYISIII